MSTARSACASCPWPPADPVFEDLAYLNWAERHYRSVRVNLAASGIPDVPATMLPMHESVGTSGPSGLSDWSHWTAFRERIAARYGVPTAEVLPTLGTSQAVFLACASLLEAGDEVIVETPTYEPLVSVPRGLGAVVTQVPRRSSRSFDLDPEEVLAAMTPRTRLVIVSSPHNPTGHPVTEASLTTIHDACLEYDAWLLVDEVYGDFGPGAPTSARKVGERVLAASSFTKSWGLGWARAGWLLGPASFIEDRAMAALRHSAGQNGTTHVALGVAALQAREALDERTRRIVGDGRTIIDRWVAAHDALSWRAPPFGLYGWVEVEGAVDVRARVERAYADHGLLVAPGEFFGPERSAFRIGWTMADDRLDESLALLARVLEL